MCTSWKTLMLGIMHSPFNPFTIEGDVRYILNIVEK